MFLRPFVALLPVAFAAACAQVVVAPPAVPGPVSAAACQAAIEPNLTGAGTVRYEFASSGETLQANVVTTMADGTSAGALFVCRNEPDGSVSAQIVAD